MRGSWVRRNSFCWRLRQKSSSLRTSKYRRTPSLKTETSGPAWCNAIVLSPPGDVQARIHRFIFIAEVFDELEFQQVSVESESALHVFRVDHGMIKSKFPASIQGDGNLVLL